MQLSDISKQWPLKSPRARLWTYAIVGAARCAYMVRGWGVRWWLAMVPVVGRAMVCVVKVRWKVMRILSQKEIESDFFGAKN
jgi:hypothetical protein